MFFQIQHSVIYGQTGTLSVKVYEAGSEELLPCRVWIDIGSGHLFKPTNTECVPYRIDGSFSCNGVFEITVPARSVLLHVERGKEYLPVNKEITIHENQTTNIVIFLKRWINMVGLGWYSMDVHCHFGADSLDILKQTAFADDINFEPVLSVWNRRRYKPIEDVWSGNPKDAGCYADPTHLITFRNEEIERIGGAPFESIGALLMLGLSKLIQAESHTFPCDAMLARFAKTHSPQCIIDMDKPNWGENVVGVALGLFNSVQLCHNHYHRYSDLHMGWGMAEFPISSEQKESLFNSTNNIYYHYLNCGFKLAATGGSAMGVMRLPLGYNRTYAKLSGDLTESNYLKAIQQGRTFATSGPMLFLTANGLDCGETIQHSIKKNDPIHIHAELKSINPIDYLELIYNGKVIKKVLLEDRIPAPILNENIDFELTPLRSGWIAARALFHTVNGYRRQTHTSPIYIQVDDKPTAFKKDAEILIQWVDRLLDISHQPARYSIEEERRQVQTLYQETKSVYQRIIHKAEKYWDD